jgi:hypothetical protein
VRLAWLTLACYYVNYQDSPWQKELSMTAKVIEIVDVQLLEGQEVLNVFHFVDPAGTGDEAVLVSDYISDVIPLMVGIQHADLTHIAVRHRVVYPTAALVHTTPISPPVAGGVTGTDVLSSATAFSFAWALGVTVVLAGGFTGHLKRGGCRTAAVPESYVDGNEAVAGSITNAAAWVAELLNPGTDAFLLCVASYLNGARVRQPTVQSYALVTGASVPAPSTQNTRKVLRGRTR